MSMCPTCKMVGDGVDPRDTPGYNSGQKRVGRGKHCCEYEMSCTCQHKIPGAWKGRVPSPSPSLPTLSVSQARRLLAETLQKQRPSQCSVCARRVALTPKSRRVVRHKRRSLVELTYQNGETRMSLRNFVCPGSGKSPLARGTVSDATTSSLPTTDG